MEGVDYSFSRPDINCLWNNDKRFVVRYATSLSSNKQASYSEIQALLNKGFLVCIVYQDDTGDPLRGYNEGVKDGKAAQHDLDTWGLPRIPIYFALDQDPNPLSANQIDNIHAYFRGVQTTIPYGRTGIYGGHRAIELFVPTTVHLGWQTYAWSSGKVSSKAHLYQYRNGVNLCGGQVDLNKNLKTNFGQWPETTKEDDMPLDSTDLTKIRNIVNGAVSELDDILEDDLRRTLQFLTTGQRNELTGTGAVGTWQNTGITLNKLAHLVAGIDPDVTVNFDAEDVKNLADALINAGIGPAVAKTLGEKLSS